MMSLLHVFCLLGGQHQGGCVQRKLYTADSVKDVHVLGFKDVHV